MSATDYYASSFGYGESATGGTGGEVITVNNATALTSAVNKRTDKRIVIITQSIEYSSIATFQDFSNVTILGMPGVTLTNLQQNRDNSGVWHVKRASNVIIRNLTFIGPGAYDCDGKDLLCFEGVTNTWVDHCDFQDGCDGNFDNKANTDNVTVSWCRFRYLKPPKAGGSGGSADHRYTNLLGSSADDKPSDGTFNMTWAYCWWDNGCVERMLRCRNASLHFLNCYWNSNTANYYIGPENIDAYIEGCTFEGGGSNMTGKSGRIFYENYGGTNGVKYVNSVSTVKNNTTLTNITDRAVVTPSYAYTALTAAESKTAITDATCGAGATLVVTTDGTVSSACEESTDPEIVVSPTTVTMTALVGTTAPYKDVSVKGRNLESNISVSSSNSKITATTQSGWNNTTGGTLRISINSTATAGTEKATITVKSGDVTKTIAVTVTVKEPEQFTVTIEQPTAGGTITVTDADGNAIESGSSVLENTVLTLTNTPTDGYTFKNFTANGESTSSPYTVTGNVTISADFKNATSGTYAERTISNEGKTSLWDFTISDLSSAKKDFCTSTNTVLDFECEILVKESASEKFQIIAEGGGLNTKATTWLYIPVPAGGAGSITVTAQSDKADRFLQLEKDGTVTNSTYIAMASAGTTKSFTASDLTTYNGKTYLVLKSGSDFKLTTFTIDLTSGSYTSGSTCTAPTIGTHPSTSAQTYANGASATALTVVATGSSLSYQWYSNSSASTTGGSAISGATGTSYTPQTTTAGTLYYYCVVKSGDCSTTSNVSGAITVQAAAVTPPAEGEFTTVCVESAGIQNVQPMTGLVLWPSSKTSGDYKNSIQLEFIYCLPYDVVTGKVDGKIQYDWSSLESDLNAIKDRGHQAIVRFRYENPNNDEIEGQPLGSTAVPAYIKALSDYNETYNVQNPTEDNPGGDGTTYYADWSSDELKWFTKQFMTDFAAKYGNDNRIAVLQVGFGHWSEYHIYGTDLEFGVNFPTKDYQAEFLTHMANVMPIPWGCSTSVADASYSPLPGNSALKALQFGIFDDSFMHENHQDWNEMLWNNADGKTTRWKTGVCGGEISYYTTEDQHNFLNPAGMYGRTWAEETAEYHITYMFANDAPNGSYGTPAHFKTGGMQAGYKFKLMTCETNGSVSRITMTNTGVAPIYRDAFVTVGGVRASESLKGLLPGETKTFTVNAAATATNVTIESDYILPTQTIEYDVADCSSGDTPITPEPGEGTPIEGLITNDFEFGSGANASSGRNWASTITTKEPTKITSLSALSPVGFEITDHSNRAGQTVKVHSSGTTKNTGEYMQLSFTVADGYALHVTDILVQPRAVSSDGTFDAVLTDGASHQIAITGRTVPESSATGAEIFQASDFAANPGFVGNVTLKIYAYGSQSAYRYNDNVVIDGYLVESIPSGTTQYTVSYTQPTGGVISVTNGDATVTSGTKVDENTELTISATANTGYELTSLTVNDNTFPSGNTHKVTSATTIVATFTPLTYTITYDANGGNAVANGSYTYGTGLTQLPTTTREGYTFDGWYDASNNQVTSISNTQTGNITLTAQWTTESGSEDLGCENPTVIATISNPKSTDSGSATYSVAANPKITASWYLSSAGKLDSNRYLTINNILAGDIIIVTTDEKALYMVDGTSAGTHAIGHYLLDETERTSHTFVIPATFTSGSITFANNATFKDAAGTTLTKDDAKATITKVEVKRCLSVCDEVVISADPASAEYAFGAEDASALSVTVTGGESFTYQWQYSADNSTWENAGTEATLTPSTAAVGTTYYRCIVTNDCGNTATSKVATIRVQCTQVTPELKNYPSQIILSDHTASVTLDAKGHTGTPTYASSDDNVLTVGSDGKLTPKGVGKATITVTIPAKDAYCDATATTAEIEVIDGAYYYRGDDNGWGATAMHKSDDGLYYWIESSNNTNQFMISKTVTTNDYNCAYVSKNFNNTNVNDIGDYGGNNCYCWQDGTYYILVYLPGTPINTTDKPIICASTSLPYTTVTYDVSANTTLYFANDVHQWEKVYFRIGHETYNEAVMNKVSGTANLYSWTAPSNGWGGFLAAHWADNCSWTNNNSIYLVNPDGTEFDITEATVHIKENVSSSFTTVPAAAGNLNENEGVTYYPVPATYNPSHPELGGRIAGMWSHNAKITAPSNGTLRVTYTDIHGTEGQTLTTSDISLAHTTILTIATEPDEGYELDKVYVNGEEYADATYVLTADAEISATFKQVSTGEDDCMPEVLFHYQATDHTDQTSPYEFIETLSGGTMSWTGVRGKNIKGETLSYVDGVPTDMRVISGEGIKLESGDGYLLITLTGGNTLQEGDTIHISGHNTYKMSDEIPVEGEKLRDTKWDVVTGVDAEHCAVGTFVFPAGVNTTQLAIKRTSGTSIAAIKITRPCPPAGSDPAGTTLTFEGKEDDSWSNAANWAPNYNVLPTINDKVIINQPVVVSANDAHCAEVLINTQGAGHITIAPTGGLSVLGTIRAIHGDDTTTKYATTADDILIQSSATAQGALAYKDQSETIGATVEYYSRAYGATTTSLDNALYQYMGIPLHNNTASAISDFHKGWMFRWNEPDGMWYVVSNDEVLHTFTGYSITQETAKTYTLQGNLVPSGKREVQLQYTSTAPFAGQNLITNSWMAPLQLEKFETTDFIGADPTMYIFETGSYSDWQNNHTATEPTDIKNILPGQYLSLPVKTAAVIGFPAIAPMQAFFVMASDEGSLTLDYERLCFNSAHTLTTHPMRTPAAVAAEPEKCVIAVQSEHGADRVFLLQKNDYTDQYTPGYDGYKIYGGAALPYLAAITTDGDMNVWTTPSLIGTQLNFFKAADDTQYTIGFEYNGTQQFCLRDHLTQQEVEIRTGNTYTFTDNSATEAARFEIVKKSTSGDVATDLLSVSATADALYLHNPAAEAVQVNVFTVDGKLLQSLTTSNQLVELNVPANGVYLIHLTTEHSSRVLKQIYRRGE